MSHAPPPLTVLPRGGARLRRAVRNVTAAVTNRIRWGDTSSRLTLAAFAALEALAGDWPMLARDPARRGSTPDELRPPFVRQWYRLFPDEGLQSGVQPVVAGERLYIGTLAGFCHAIDTENGREVWAARADGPILHSAAVAEGKVVFGAADGSVYAVQADDGTVAWKYSTGVAIWNAPLIHQGTAFIGGRDGFLYALELGNGNLRWKADPGAPLLNSPALDPNTARIYVGSESMRVHAFAAADGRELWRSEKLPGASMRGYHPVIAPDGSVLVTTQPVLGYDRFQSLLLDMTKAVFGDFASWRHTKEENTRLRAENFRLLEKPETYQAQLDYLRRRLVQEPQFQTLFVLDPATGRQRFVAPVVASESMNGPAAPPVVAPDGRVIVKYQVLLRSRYEHYSPFLNVGYLDTQTGHITPIMDQSRTYGWHDSLLLVHDEQSQLSVAGRLLFNTHQDNVNALDLDSLKGYPEPFARNIHEPAPGEALAIRLATIRGQSLPSGKEWLIRGTAVYGGGSVLDVPVVVAGNSFYYLPTHELNAGCALIAYRSSAGPNPNHPGNANNAAAGNAPREAQPRTGETPLPAPTPTPQEWRTMQELPWDWDTLGTARLKSFLDGLPGPVPGTTAAPMTAQAREQVARLPDATLDETIWRPAFDPAAEPVSTPDKALLRQKLVDAVRELLEPWQPLVVPAAKAPEEAYRFFDNPGETVYTLLLARSFLGTRLQAEVDAHVARLVAAGLDRKVDPQTGASRVPYTTPLTQMRVVDEPAGDPLASLYPLWLWSRLPTGREAVAARWPELRQQLSRPAPKLDDDCGNSRIAGLIAYCRLARAQGDEASVNEALPVARQALRERLTFELAHPRGGLIRVVPNGRSVLARWHRLAPDLAAFLATHAASVTQGLMEDYVDHQRPGWWLAWNVEQLWRNEAPFQLPSTPFDIFNARALLLRDPAPQLEARLDLPWCKADEYYIRKLALTLHRGE